jgi:hypothetical protein
LEILSQEVAIEVSGPDRGREDIVDLNVEVVAVHDLACKTECLQTYDDQVHSIVGEAAPGESIGNGPPSGNVPDDLGQIVKHHDEDHYIGEGLGFVICKPTELKRVDVES